MLLLLVAEHNTYIIIYILAHLSQRITSNSENTWKIFENLLFQNYWNRLGTHLLVKDMPQL